MDQVIKYKTVTITVRRDDLLHKDISGNKFRKLKYNILEAQNNDFKGIVTFGGAFSNHIAAAAAAGKVYSIKTIGIIRGEEWEHKINLNSTLSFAQANGMEFIFVSRDEYKLRNSKDYITDLQSKYQDYYIIPEGGSNDLAIQGCEEIIDLENDSTFDYVCCAVGTGATIAGVSNSLEAHQMAIGFVALNDFSVINDIEIWSQNKICQLKLNFEYNLGAYAKINDDLVQFINDFFNKFEIPLDPIYTGKMFYGIFDMIDKKIIEPYSNILAIHTGGLQGIKGMNDILSKKNKKLIQVVF